MSPASGYAGDSRVCKSTNQLRGAEIGGGPRPTGFFGRSVPT
jgi:hypothetical protein